MVKGLCKSILSKTDGDPGLTVRRERSRAQRRFLVPDGPATILLRSLISEAYKCMAWELTALLNGWGLSGLLAPIYMSETLMHKCHCDAVLVKLLYRKC